MRVTLETSGGYGGLRRSADVDTGDLSAVDVPAALAALAAGQAGHTGQTDDARAARPRPGPPAPRYRLTVYRADGPQVVELAEPAVPAAVRPLLAELMARARPAD